MAFVAGAAAAATRSVAAHVSSNETSFEKQKAVFSLFLLLSHSLGSLVARFFIFSPSTPQFRLRFTFAGCPHESDSDCFMGYVPLLGFN